MEASSDSESAINSPIKSPEKLEEEEEEEKEEERQRLSTFQCTLFDPETVRKLAQSFLPGIATACVDHTSGDPFNSPGSVASDLRREMVEYVTRRSEAFVAETVLVEPGPEFFSHPYDVVSDFLEDFAALKRSLFARVSGWALSEKREDKIDDFAHEIATNGFWPTEARESVARTLLKNIDVRNEFCCGEDFGSPEELAGHVRELCLFRPLTCRSEGCDSIFSAKNAEIHGSVCGFRVVPCEQGCSERVTRREMDRHCVASCEMRLVSCPFYALGCRSTVPYRGLDRHCSEGLRSHLLCVLRSVHKKVIREEEELNRRAERVENASLPGELEKARDVRLLTSAVKNLEAKLGPYIPEETPETTTLEAKET